MSAGSRLRACAAMLLLGGVPAANGQAAQPWPDNVVSRIAALAVLETLNADLLSHDSATSTLERWCAQHRLAVPARILAIRVTGIDRPASPEQRRDLRVSESEPLRFRRVRLACGSVVLSEADNWYVPARLSPDMNRQLESSDTPFGKVVAPLRFQRHTLSADILWRPLPEGWDMGAVLPPTAGVLAIPAEVLRHRAVLALPDGTPISVLVETYASGVFDFAPHFAPGALQSSPN